MYLSKSPLRGDSKKYTKRMFFLKNNKGISIKKTRSADFCADRIDVITNFAVITNVVIKRVHCTQLDSRYVFRPFFLSFRLVSITTASAAYPTLEIFVRVSFNKNVWFAKLSLRNVCCDTVGTTLLSAHAVLNDFLPKHTLCFGLMRIGSKHIYDR